MYKLNVLSNDFFQIKKTNTKCKIVLRALFCIGCLSILSCVSNNAIDGSSRRAPDWVTNVNSVYPDSQWLAAVGYGSDRSSAEKEAVAEISKIIKQNIESETSIKQKDVTETGSSFFGSHEQSNFTQEYSSNVTTKAVLDDINGVYIQEIWTSQTGDVYAVAALNRNEVGMYYAEKISSYTEVINSEITRADKVGVSLDSLGALLHALSLAQDNENFLDILSVVNPIRYKIVNLTYKSAQSIAVRVANEIQQISICIAVKEDVSGRIAQAFADQFTAVGFKTKILTTLDETEMKSDYCLVANVTFEDVDMSEDSKYQFVRFVVDSQLIDTKTKQVILPYSINGREAHKTVSEARQRALRSIEDKVTTEYEASFLNALYED